ncbi:retrotransposon-related protein [Trifolium pratense]|uniref:Retrotransposon-related protein n=1 Tax=Trifolium pratense TaxID=57577 RepID=A0A2K3PP49_TRIPR|nr:retrotransposon-related protein [Trifolium pratense]
MGDRVDALENQMGEVQATLKSLAEQMQQQSKVMTELCKQLGKRTTASPSPESEGSIANELSESRLAGKKVKLPMFEGEDPVAWITRAEIYFDVQNTTEEMKVKLARLSMEGPTIHWFNLMLETEDDLSWIKLKKALIARYGGRRLENPFEELSALKQTGSVEDYVEAFELLSSQVGRLPEEQYLGYFMSGLKAQIRRRVRTLNPSSRLQMMRIAKDVEEELKEEDDENDRRFGKKLGGERMGRSDWFGPNSNRNGSGQIQKESKPNPSQKTGSHNSNLSSSSSLASTGRKMDNDSRSNSWKGIRSIHSDEVVERRAKGLCFKCGGKWHPTQHKCPEKSIRVLILGDGETINEEGEIIAMEGAISDDEEEVEVECKSMGVLGSMGGHRTMKIEGKIAEVDVLVLIDSGATHNFISPQIVTALGLKISPMAEKHIKLGDGQKVVSAGVCRDVKMKLGDIQIVVDA